MDNIEMKLTDKLIAQFCPAYPMMCFDTQRKIRDSFMAFVNRSIMPVVQEEFLKGMEKDALAALEHKSDEIAALKIELVELEKAFRKRMPDDEWLNINYPKDRK